MMIYAGHGIGALVVYWVNILYFVISGAFERQLILEIAQPGKTTSLQVEGNRA